MRIKDAKLYFGDDDCVAFDRVRFLAKYKFENFRFMKGRYKDFTIHINMNERKFDKAPGGLMFIEFNPVTGDDKLGPLIRMPYTGDEQRNKMLILNILRKMLKIFYNFLIKVKEYYDKNIINEDFRSSYYVMFCIKDDGGPNYVSKWAGCDLYFHINKADFDNVDSINYDEMIFHYIGYNAIYGDKVVFEDNIMYLGISTIFFPKSYNIGRRLENYSLATSRIDMYVEYDNIVMTDIFGAVVKDRYEPVKSSKFMKRYGEHICINYRTPLSLWVKFMENVKYMEEKYIYSFELSNDYDIMKYM